MAKILLIDDEQDLLAMLAEGLMRDGHRVTALASALSVMKSINESEVAHMFDLVVTDVMMPDVNGFDLIHALKVANPAISIIAMSGGTRVAGYESWRDMANALGVADTLTKPFSISELGRAVARTLQATGPQRGSGELAKGMNGHGPAR